MSEKQVKPTTTKSKQQNAKSAKSTKSTKSPKNVGNVTAERPASVEQGSRTDRKYISIYGPNHGGTTLLGAMLGATKEYSEVVHVGEVYAFFSKKHRLFGSKACNCGLSICPHWDVLNPRAPNPFNHIFKKNSTKVIVDSSKNNFLTSQNSWYERVPNSFDKRNVIIWRCPDALKASYRKRFPRAEADFKANEDLAILYRTIKKLKGNFVGISLERLSRTPSESLEFLCKHLNIPYFSGKENFWEFEQHHFGGAVLVKKVIQNQVPQSIVEQFSKGDSYEDIGAYIHDYSAGSLY